MAEDAIYKADIAVLAAVAALKWYLWKNDIIRELPKDSANFMKFPACNWELLFNEVLKAHRPDLFEETKQMRVRQRLDYVYSKVSPIEISKQ